MDQKINLFSKTLGVERVKLQEGLTYYTHSKSLGVADCLYVATNQRELIRALELIAELRLDFLMIGGGTKMSLDNPVHGVVIKNRTSSIKIAGIKGKFDKGLLGLAEMYVEADSGVTINALNLFLKNHTLQDVEGDSSLNSTIGGSIFLDRSLRQAAQSIKIWENGEVAVVDVEGLQYHQQIILSVIFRFKSTVGS